MVGYWCCLSATHIDIVSERTAIVVISNLLLICRCRTVRANITLLVPTVVLSRGRTIIAWLGQCITNHTTNQCWGDPTIVSAGCLAQCYNNQCNSKLFHNFLLGKYLSWLTSFHHLTEDEFCNVHLFANIFY